MSEPYTAIQIVMMPRDTNPHGTISKWVSATTRKLTPHPVRF